MLDHGLFHLRLQALALYARISIVVNAIFGSTPLSIR